MQEKTLYVSHVEILRTSTAEPTREGIVWTASKDVTRYMPLFAQTGPLLLDLGNLLDPAKNLTGEYDVTLSLSIYEATNVSSSEFPVILPLSRISKEQADYFVSSGSIEHVIPHNAREAYVELYISGNGKEEFWYANAPDEALKLLPPAAGLVGKGPFREVQLWIDDMLAGHITPFPVIYTGGILPSAWRPVAAYGAFDEPTYILDITPFLAVLCDDVLHKFTLKTIGQAFGGGINPNWFVSGNIRFVLSSSSQRTRGQIVRYESHPRPDVLVAAHVDDSGQLSARTVGTRTFAIDAELVIDGHSHTVSVRQDTSFFNVQHFMDGGLSTDVLQSIESHIFSSHSSSVAVKDDAIFSLSTNVTFDAKRLCLAATIRQLYDRSETLPASAFPAFRPQAIQMLQNANGRIQLNGTTGRIINGTGRSEQSFVLDYLQHLPRERRLPYWRQVLAMNASIVRDREGGFLLSSVVPFLDQSRPRFGPETPSVQYTGPSMLLPRWLERFTPVPMH